MAEGQTEAVAEQGVRMRVGTEAWGAGCILSW